MQNKSLTFKYVNALLKTNCLPPISSYQAYIGWSQDNSIDHITARLVTLNSHLETGDQTKLIDWCDKH